QAQAGGEGGADPVPGEVGDDPVANPAGVGLDAPSDDVQRAPRRNRADTAHHRLVGPLDRQPGFGVNAPRQERRVGVPVHTVQIGGDVHVHNVAVGDHRVVGDPVADHL